MSRYIVYYEKEVYGYKKFTANNDKDAEEFIETFEESEIGDDDLTHVKTTGFHFVEYEKEKG